MPGTTYFITRRCCQRTFRLRPDKLTSQIFLYALGVAAAKSGVQVHAICVMSNHHHCVVTDPNGTLPVFLAELHRTTAKVLNAAQGQSESLWGPGPSSAAEVADDAALVDRIAYTAVNPVAAGLVAKPEDWPGITLWEPVEFDVPRPNVFFDEEGVSPQSVTVRIVRPERGRLSDGSWKRRLDNAIRFRVLKAHQRLRREGRTFLGRAAVLSQSFMKRALSLEPKRLFVPKVAACDEAAKSGLLGILQRFRAAYYEALSNWRDGSRNAVFPAGTWWMRVHHGASIAPG